MKWTEQVARLGKVKIAYKISVGETWWRDHLQDLGIDGNATLKWFLKK
jgi:hypothetical protein